MTDERLGRLVERIRLGGRAEHGTVGGARRHRSEGTPTCAPCRRALDVRKKARREAMYRLRKVHPEEYRRLVEEEAAKLPQPEVTDWPMTRSKHGTMGGRALHSRNKTEACKACLLAERVVRTSQRAALARLAEQFPEELERLREEVAPTPKPERPRRNPDLQWEDEAECRGVDGALPDVMFPKSPSQARIAIAAMCDSCPVIAQCAEVAMKGRYKVGVWGGVHLQERRMTAEEFRLAKEAGS